MNEDVLILYVDDEPINLSIFEINFRKKYKIITASSGPKGLEKLEDNKDVIIVISDMKMPEMDGIEFIRKAKEKYLNVSYFILTGFDITDKISAALEDNTIQKYFRKPLNIKEINAAIQEALKG